MTFEEFGKENEKEDDIRGEHTKAHFIYANEMEEKYAAPVLAVIDEFMQMPV